ncbi:alpha/beta-hydrolase [Trametopsis cervina]|nr:alpha/beta-hydrolase [Trametopsis cervina]
MRQLFKGLYILYEVVTTLLIRAPLWYILAIPRRLRPKPSWTIGRTFHLRFLQYICAGSSFGPWLYSLMHIPNYLALEQGLDVKGVWIPAVPQHVHGHLAQWAKGANVKPVCIPGYWLEKKGTDLPVDASPLQDEKVLLVLHGGGYTAQSAHPHDLCANIPRGILEYAGPNLVRAFMVEYRLSKPATETPSNPFPAALLDALAGYCYLVYIVGFAPKDIIIEGDSAGGNLALALTRYLIETAATSPGSPGALVLCSPWLDLGPYPIHLSSSVHANKATDYIDITGAGHRAAISSFIGPHGMAETVTNPYISPASQARAMPSISFKGFPRTFILSGGGEAFRDEIRVLRDKMEDRDTGSDAEVKYVEFPDAWHDFLLFSDVEPERSTALAMIVEWIDQMA